MIWRCMRITLRFHISRLMFEDGTLDLGREIYISFGNRIAKREAEGSDV